jgi:hypothetical protein
MLFGGMKTAAGGSGGGSSLPTEVMGQANMVTVSEKT